MKRFVLVLAFVAPSFCGAQDEPPRISIHGWYAGGAFGQAKVADLCGDVARISSVSLSSCDERDDYYKAYLGYQVLPFVAVEAAYNSLGTYRATGTFAALASKARAKASAATLRAVIEAKADPFSIFGAAGIMRWDAEVDAKNASGTIYHSRDSGYSYNWGVGAGFDIDRWWTVRLEYEEFNDVGEDATTGQADVRAISLGLQYRF